MTRPSILAALVLALGLSFASAARAQDAGQDEVVLKNGGSIRGTVVSSEPGTSVKIIELGQTQVRVVPWAQVADVQKGKYAAGAPPGPPPGGYNGPPGPPPPPPPPDGPPPGKMGDPGVVKLHMDSPQPATLIESRSALVGAYRGYGIVLTTQRPVCSAPCDQVVDGSMGRVFVLSNELYPSGPAVSFGGMTGDVTMHIEPGSTGRMIGGVWAIVLGGSAAITGAVLLPIALSSTTIDDTGNFVNSPNNGLRNAGIGLLVVGAAALGTGIALVVTGRTKIELEQRGPAHAAKAYPKIGFDTKKLALTF